MALLRYRNTSSAKKTRDFPEKEGSIMVLCEEQTLVLFGMPCVQFGEAGSLGPKKIKVPPESAWQN